MLVVVKDRNVHHLLQLFFDVEAFRSFDVLKVDAAERWFEHLYRFDNVVGVVRIQFNVKNVDVCESFEEHSLPFHHGFSRQRTDIAKTEYSGSVRDNSDKISFCRVEVRVVRVGGNFTARLSNSGGVRKREVSLRRARLAGNYFNFPPSSL